MCQICSHKMYTYKDIALVPRRTSYIESRKSDKLDITTQISPNIILNTGILSIYMDDVTEWEMAVRMAQLGGLGIIHRLMSIEDQAEQVKLVKRYENKVILNPYTISPDFGVGEIQEELEKLDVGTLLVVGGKRNLIGLVSSSHVELMDDMTKFAKDILTPTNELILIDPHGLSEDEIVEKALPLLRKHRLKNIPLATDGILKGLVSKKDILKMKNRLAVRDEKGHLLCAASLGLTDDMVERARALVDAGVDLLVLAIANGYLETCLDAVSKLKKNFPDVDLMVGNATEYYGTKKLFKAGADSVLVGIGQGTVCETRKKTGVGVASFTSIRDAVRAAREEGKFIIQDGGIKEPDEYVKALFAGASAVTIGSKLAGTDESAGERHKINGKLVKSYRGLASSNARNKAAKINNRKPVDNEYDLYQEVHYYISPEGVETGYVPYSGSAKDAVKEIIGGLRSALTYMGCRSIEELQKVCDENPFGPHGCECDNNHWAIASPDAIREANPHGLAGFTT